MTYTFAIGDVHGCLNELRALFDLIEQECAFLQERRFIFVGDYVDRGPDSKGVIDFINHLSIDEEVIPLRGNHDHMMALDLYYWYPNGARSTLQSFGVDHWEGIPKDYIEWAKNLKFYYDDGKRFFVHAGVNREPLHETSKTDETYGMIWIREPFLRNSLPWSRYVVHGHTPVELIDERANRLNIDTGCVFGGSLTCAIFDDEHVKPIGYLKVDYATLEPTVIKSEEWKSLEQQLHSEGQVSEDLPG